MLVNRPASRLFGPKTTERHSKLESTVRYLGIEVDDALQISEKTEVDLPRSTRVVPWLEPSRGAGLTSDNIGGELKRHPRHADKLDTRFLSCFRQAWGVPMGRKRSMVFIDLE